MESCTSSHSIIVFSSVRTPKPMYSIETAFVAKKFTDLYCVKGHHSTILITNSSNIHAETDRALAMPKLISCDHQPQEMIIH